jgi:probable HAF family extracellular repeat protein
MFHTHAAGRGRGLTRSSWVQLGILVVLALGSTATANVPLVGVEAAAAAEPTVVDLGTLGGATSKAVALNGLGQVAGDAETSRGATHAFRWSKGHMKDLGTLGGRDSHAIAINAGGDIVGYAQTSAGAWRAVLWPARGDRKNLGTLGGAYSRAADLNDQRQVVGTAERADGTRVAFRWTPVGGMQDLGTLGGAESNATSINGLGHVAGSSQLADGNSHAFLWAAGNGLQDLGTLGGRNSFAIAINALGQVTGTSQFDPEAPFSYAFRWTPEQGMQLLPNNNLYTFARAIGDAGDVVGGGADMPYHGSSYALRWAPSGPVTLEQPCVQYPCSAIANDVNADGVTVGSISVVDGEAAARWSADGQLQYLPGLGGAVSNAVAINASGQAAGDSWTPAGMVHAVLWR